jgi:hypothetical protein
MFAPLAILVFALFIYGVMLLWNWIMPEIFGIRTLTYWQTLGLLVLCKILFGFGFGGGGGHSPRSTRRQLFERYEKMTPEEREKFRRGLHGWCATDSTEGEPDPR